MAYNILIVDDEEMTRTIFRMTFEREGMHVSEAQDGFEALTKMAESDYDLMILDVMMPGMDGFSVCEKVRARQETAALPILMISARSDAASREKAVAAGATRYLTKPILPSELMRHIQELMSGPRA